MKNFITVFFILLAMCAVGCTNDDANQTNQRQKIESVDMEGWYPGNNNNNYSIGRSDGNFNGKPVFYIKSERGSDSGFGTITKNFAPVTYLGKRIILNGNIKIENIYGKAGMWMRVDGGTGSGPFGKTLSLDNMENRVLTQATDWQKHTIVLDVPKESRMVYYGLYLSGKGEISISDFEIEEAGSDVPATGKLY